MPTDERGRAWALPYALTNVLKTDAVEYRATSTWLRTRRPFITFRGVGPPVRCIRSRAPTPYRYRPTSVSRGNCAKSAKEPFVADFAFWMKTRNNNATYVHRSLDATCAIFA